MGVVPGFWDVPGLVQQWLNDHAARQNSHGTVALSPCAERTYPCASDAGFCGHIGLSPAGPGRVVLRGERQQESLVKRCADDRPLEALIQDCPSGQRIELKDLAARIRARSDRHPQA